MLLMVEKRIIGGITHAIHGYAEANNKYKKITIRTKNHHSCKQFVWMGYVSKTACKPL